ncbi:MAG TPA: hypothetical protein ENK72_02485 [Epsilonproteobacteria bacterium]|nr:hypothetical protein [Campylobacterota bacterium]
MKQTLETIAMVFIVLLSFVIIGLIVQYNMIEVKTTSDNQRLVIESMKPSDTVPGERDTSGYLDKLEGYEDVQVEVDPTSAPSNVNIAVVEAEASSNSMIDSIDSAIDTAEKKNYLDKLEHYNPESGVMEETPEEAPKGELGTEEVLTEDPMGAIVSDLDSIIDASL